MLGLIEGLGSFADVTNAIVYAVEGNAGAAWSSGLAAVPFIGLAATGGKWLGRGFRALGEAGLIRFGTGLRPTGSIWRAGGINPGSLRLRPGEQAISFRSSLANPWPKPASGPVFRPGDVAHAYDPSKLPRAHIVIDDAAGHVSVSGATVPDLKQAVIPGSRVRFPDD